MYDEKFMNVVGHEGVVSIVTCSDNEAHVVNTWNSYPAFPRENRMLMNREKVDSQSPPQSYSPFDFRPATAPLIVHP
jgi:hypothetical protein